MNAKIKYLNKRKYKGEQVADILVKSKKILLELIVQETLIALL